MTYQEWMREERRCGRKPSRESVWNAALRLGGTPAEQTGNSQSDEIIAGIVTYINSRLADKYCEYAEKQWLYNIRTLCGNRQ